MPRHKLIQNSVKRTRSSCLLLIDWKHFKYHSTLVLPRYEARWGPLSLFLQHELQHKISKSNLLRYKHMAYISIKMF